MVIKDVLTESAYPVEVAYDENEVFNVTINDTTIFIDKKEWNEISKFINDSMDFILERVGY